MANIPVERNDGNGGLPWWAWLLGLLALLLLGSLLFRGCDNEDTEATEDDVTAVDDEGVSTAGDFDEDPTAMDDGSADGAATGAAFTSIDALNRDLNDTGMAAGSLDNRMVTLTNVPVTSVVGDSTFYVGTGSDRVLVILQDEGEQAQGSGGSDGDYNVDTGDRVTVRGRVRTYNATMRGLSTLGNADRTEVQRRRYVIVTDPGGLSSAGGGDDATAEADSAAQ